MKRITITLAAALLAALIAAPRSEAGRIGGPAAEAGVLAPGQSVFFDIPFAAGGPANIAVMGTGAGNVDLYVYDGDGNVIEGAGAFERRVAVVDVYRAGLFRVELRNTGAVPSLVLVGTN